MLLRFTEVTDLFHKFIKVKRIVLAPRQVYNFFLSEISSTTKRSEAKKSLRTRKFISLVGGKMYNFTNTCIYTFRILPLHPYQLTKKYWAWLRFPRNYCFPRRESHNVAKNHYKDCRARIFTDVLGGYKSIYRLQSFKEVNEVFRLYRFTELYRNHRYFWIYQI